MYNAGSLTMDKCRFIGNAAQSGGGMENNTSWDAPMTNCLFTGNYARSDGGAISTKCAAIRCRNCTFSLNRAEGDGFYRGGGITGDDDTDIWLTNCILWGNTDLDGAPKSTIAASRAGPVVSAAKGTSETTRFLSTLMAKTAQQAPRMTTFAFYPARPASMQETPNTHPDRTKRTSTATLASLIMPLT